MNGAEYDVVVVGAGPAGLGAAVTAAKLGAKVLLVDENHRPGGQLFKQLHKFFGSVEHYAGVRGYHIGTQLLEEARQVGVEILLDTVVFGLFGKDGIGLDTKDGVRRVKSKKIVLATGAFEKSLTFPGWTKAGVMGAGAAQTMINLWRVMPGKRFLVVGSGNVGLIVAYQILQAGGIVQAVIEAAPKISGYAVHAGKIRRAGVPILTSTTVRKVTGDDKVEKATIVSVDEQFHPVAGTERELDVDIVCLAVGLNPLTELAYQQDCRFLYVPELGGNIPLHDENMKTTTDDIYVAGDIAGIEEASTALDEGRLAGVAASEAIGLIDAEEATRQKEEIRQRLNQLRSGIYGERRFNAKRRLVDTYAL